MPSAQIAPATETLDFISPPRNEQRSKGVFYCAMALVFARISMVNQILAAQIGTSFYMIYWVGIPAILGIIFAGGIKHAWPAKPTKYWTMFGLWMILTTLFSYWPGGSFEILRAYLRSELVMVFAIAGLTTTWRECRLMILAAAAGGFVNLLGSQIFGSSSGDRMSITVGAVANPNDFAAHLLLVLPFIVYVTLSSKSVLLRIVSVLAVGYGAYFVLGSGSRGAAIGIAADVLFLLLSTPPRRRLLVWVTTALVLIVTIKVLPQQTWTRITSIVDDRDAPEEAASSSEDRKYLLRKSIEYTFQHPLFGVGPGQFSNFEGSASQAKGVRGSWHETHNTYTEASSENGLIAFFFYAAGIVWTVILLNRTWARVRHRRDLHDIANAVFCLRVSLVGFCTAIFFVNFAYYFYLPAMAGFAIAISRAADAAIAKDPEGDTSSRRLVVPAY